MPSFSGKTIDGRSKVLEPDLSVNLVDLAFDERFMDIDSHMVTKVAIIVYGKALEVDRKNPNTVKDLQEFCIAQTGSRLNQINCVHFIIETNENE